jgi:hypothetical protein
MTSLYHVAMQTLLKSAADDFARSWMFRSTLALPQRQAAATPPGSSNWPPPYSPGRANAGLWVERGVIWLMPDALPIGFIDTVSAHTFLLPGNLSSKVLAPHNVGSSRSYTVSGMPALTVGAAMTENVSGTTLTVGSAQTANVTGGSGLTVGAARTANVSGSGLTIGSAMTANVSGATITVGAARSTSVGGKIVWPMITAIPLVRGFLTQTTGYIPPAAAVFLDPARATGFSAGSPNGVQNFSARHLMFSPCGRYSPGTSYRILQAAFWRS